MIRPLLSPRHVLPLIILTAVLMLGLRLGGMWDAFAEGHYASVRPVQAADEEKKTDEKKAQEPPKEEQKKAEEKGQDKQKDEAKKDAPIDPSPAPPAKAKASTESDLFRHLQGRREQLDKRAQELDSREALLDVTEKRVEQKLKEMEELRGQLQKLLGQADEAQQAQIENLVKIYEIMKPKEAAKILETLDLPVLLGVVQRMKPARTAAMMAEMNPEKAREITTALTRKDQLPRVK